MNRPSHLEQHFRFLLLAEGLEDDFEREWRFHPQRRWKFDFANPDPDILIAVELEGGIWIKGRHTTGKGFEADCEKYNTALSMGWRVLRYPSIKAMREFPNHYKQLLAL